MFYRLYYQQTMLRYPARVANLSFSGTSRQIQEPIQHLCTQL